MSYGDVVKPIRAGFSVAVVYQGTAAAALAPVGYAIMSGENFYDFAVEP